MKYNALDPDLQLWVAACLYKGGVDVRRIFIGEMDDETADQHYRDSMALGTMLQMRRRCGPPTERPSINTGMSNWRRSTSTIGSAPSSTLSRWPE